MCGENTKLIFYMSPGQTITRTFTAKDTHSPLKELLVTYAEVARVGAENRYRAEATTAVLGFEAPSFTYGTDLILPADTNEQLRALMRASVGDDESIAAAAKSAPSWLEHEEDMQLFSKYESIMPGDDPFDGMFVPEVRCNVLHPFIRGSCDPSVLSEGFLRRRGVSSCECGSCIWLALPLTARS